MAHWYHRNPLKATATVLFDLQKQMVAADSQALKLCSELRQARANLLTKLSDPNHEVSTIENSLQEYLALFQGFLTSIDPPGGESKLRYCVRFRWTHTMLGNAPIAQQDSVYELVCICQNVAIWMMKHASVIAGKDDIKMEEAKDVHKCLRKAAGYFTAMQDRYVGQLLQKVEPGSDLDIKVMSAYINQCTGEAQEVTIARAIELKHAPSLISALAHETSKMYTSSADYLAGFESKNFEKWQKYLRLKAVFYLAYAYCYLGESMLAQEKCGDAIRALQESHKCYEDAGKLCKDYARCKGSGINAKPEQHLFFRNLAPLINRTLEKCERENGFIFHQKVPHDPPKLELKATYGLVSPEDFHMAEPSPLWTLVAYAAFNPVGVNPNDPANSKAATKAEGDLPPVQEATIHQTTTDPKNASGCTLQ